MRTCMTVCSVGAVLLAAYSTATATVNSEEFLAANGYVAGMGLSEQTNSFWNGTGSTATAGILDVVDYIPNGTDFGLKLTANTAAGTAGANGRTDLGGADGWGGPNRAVANAKLYWSVDIQKGTGAWPGGANVWQISFIRATGNETFFALYGSMDTVGAKVWTGNGTTSTAGAPATLATHPLLDNWNRVTIVNDPVASTSEFQMYLNGTLVDTFDVLTNSGATLTGIPLLRTGSGIQTDQVIIDRLNRGANDPGWDATMGLDNIVTANEALNMSQPPPTALIPEPAALGLALLGVMPLLRRRRAA
jgi:hypothetical protein